MAILRTREAAEEFAEGDFFVVDGAVRAWRVRGRNEALAADVPAPAAPLAAWRHAAQAAAWTGRSGAVPRPKTLASATWSTNGSGTCRRTGR